MMDMPEKTGEQSQEQASPGKESPVKSAFKGVIRRASMAGVAQSGILSRLEHVKKFSRITGIKQIPSLFHFRKRVESFTAEVRTRQSAIKPIAVKKQAKNLNREWQKMDMVLPSGTPSEEGQRIEPFTASLSTTGSFSAGQIIPPFEAEPGGRSEFSKRMQTIADSPQREPPQPKKRIAPQSRLYSKVVEINPRKSAEQAETQPDVSEPLPKPTAASKPHLSGVEPNRIQPQPDADRTPRITEIKQSAAPHSQPEEKPASHPVSPEPDQVLRPGPKMTNTSPVSRIASNMIQREPQTVEQNPGTPPVEPPTRMEQKAAPEKPLSEIPLSNSKPDLPFQIKRSRNAAYKLSPVRAVKMLHLTGRTVVQRSVDKPAKIVAEPPHVLPETIHETRPVISRHTVESVPANPAAEKAVRWAPVKTEPSPEMPLILKPTFKPGKRFVSRTPTRSHSIMALNIIRGMPEKNQIRRKASAPLDPGLPKQSVQLSPRQMVSPQIDEPRMMPAPDQTMTLPAAAEPKPQTAVKPLPLTRQPALKPHALTRQPAARTIRQTNVPVVQRQFVKPSVRLGTPLQMSVYRNTTRRFSQLTTNRPQPAPTVSSVSPAAQTAQPTAGSNTVVRKPPAGSGVLSPSAPIMSQPPSLPAPVFQRAPAPRRTLIHQPVILGQARALSQTVHQRAQNHPGMQSLTPTDETRSPRPITAASFPPIILPGQSQPSPMSVNPPPVLPQLLGSNRSNRNPEQNLSSNPNNLPLVRNSIHSGSGNTIQRDSDGSENYVTDDDINRESEPARENYYVASGNRQEAPPSPQQPQQTPPQQPVYQQSSQPPQQQQQPQSQPQTAQQPMPAYELRMPQSEADILPPQAQEKIFELPPEEEAKISTTGQRTKPENPETNLQQLARDVLPFIRKMIAIEKERSSIR